MKRITLMLLMTFIMLVAAVPGWGPKVDKE